MSREMRGHCGVKGSSAVDLCPQERGALKVAGHPACSAACLRVEIEWEICHMDLSLPSNYLNRV